MVAPAGELRTHSDALDWRERKRILEILDKCSQPHTRSLELATDLFKRRAFWPDSSSGNALPRNYCQEITSSEALKLVVPSTPSLPNDQAITPMLRFSGPAPVLGV